MPAPARLGRYPVRRRLGAGAFATVWLAHDDHLDSDVAIKVLADNWSEDLHIRQRFVEEGRFLRKVESRHVVPVYDAGELEDGRPYLVMAYADEGTLADRLELSRLSPSEALHVICQVGTGLHALHERGVLHRDVKPANVLFRTSSNGELVAMLGDLGLGKAMDMSSRLTVVGGTPAFAAPEQARGEGLDPRADLYSLAALAYLLVTGHRPHEHASLGAATDPPPPPPMTDFAPDVPPEVDAVVRRALSADREERYVDVPAFLSALVAATGGAELRAPQPWDHAADHLAVNGHPTSTEPSPTATVRPDTTVPRRQRRPLLVTALCVLALLLGGVGGALAESMPERERRVVDADGTIGVTVPEEWSEVDVDGWQLPATDGTDIGHSAISAGEVPGWQAEGANGVFVGLLPGTSLPRQVPRHPECENARPAIDDEHDGDRSRTVFFTGCPGDSVTVERVVQVTVNLLLWVQVRSDDRATANRVLDSVGTSGL